MIWIWAERRLRRRGSGAALTAPVSNPPATTMVVRRLRLRQRAVNADQAAGQADRDAEGGQAEACHVEPAIDAAAQVGWGIDLHRALRDRRERRLAKASGQTAFISRS